MRGFLILFATCGAMLAGGAGQANAVEPKPLAGWFGVFPYLDNFSPRYQRPVVAKGKNPTAYRQEVAYDQISNDAVTGTATLARDPEFKTKYTAKAFMEEGAIEVVVGKKTGWLRAQAAPRLEDFATAGKGQELVVPLADDKALIVKGVVHFGPAAMVKLACLFDPAKALEALAKPPRTEWTRSMETFRELPRAAAWRDILEWAGYPDKTTLKEMRVEGADYNLPDDSTIRLSLKDGKLTGVACTSKDGKTEELAIAGAAQADDDSPGGVEWTTLFPHAPSGYALAFDAPVVAKGDNPVAYRLTGRYDWTGDDFRSATATMARDPEFKTKYSTEAMKKDLHKEIMVGKKTGWLRRGDGAGVKPQWELIVPLAEDKALILTARGNYNETALKALAESFDLVRVEAALAKPPHGNGKKE